jgi:uncharacterized protein YggE
MTITLNPRKLALLAVSAAAMLAAYILGTSQSSVAEAARVPIGVATPSAATTGIGSAEGITVSGIGKVTGVPDTLRINLSVNATAANIDDALASANNRMASVQRSLGEHGVAAKDLQTSGLSIQPNYTSSGAPAGYAIYENLAATIRSLSRAGNTLSAAVAAGGNAIRIDGVNVALDDTSALMAGARTNAMADAKAKATQYANAAGRSLGSVLSISETISTPGPVYDYSMRAASAAAPVVPIQSGSQDVSVNVTVVYAFA